MYDSFLARSFSKNEQKKMGYGASAAVFFILFTFVTVFKPYLLPNLPVVVDLKTSVIGGSNKMLTVKETVITPTKQGIAETEDVVMESELERSACNATNCLIAGDEQVTVVLQAVEERKPLCDITGPRTDFCNLTGDIRIQPSSFSVVVVSPQTTAFVEDNTPWKIKPYARKGDSGAMNNVREWSVTTLTHQPRLPTCTKYHSVPAVMFSAGGYSGNHFHSFTDIIVPLFVTTRAFNGEVQLLITNLQPWWVSKFRAILENLSRYEVIDIDRDRDSVHCFPSAVIGLRRHNELSIDPAKSPYTMKDFKSFLRKSYSLKRTTAIQLQHDDLVSKVKPRLLIVSRKRTRSFTNVARIAKMARRTGFEVVVSEPDMNVQKVAEIMNSCDVVMGVHGAGLTNILFLPDHAVFIQILPVGNFEWLSSAYFGVPSKEMKLSYLEYKIGVKESSLIQEFPVDHVVLKDPYAFHKGNWEMFKKVYLEKQNVRLDVKRFRPTLLKALEILHEKKRGLSSAVF